MTTHQAIGAAIIGGFAVWTVIWLYAIFYFARHAPKAEDQEASYHA